MCAITIEVPEETMTALKVTADSVGQHLRMAAAMKLFELGQLSSGAAAMLAGVPRTVFFSRLADFGIDTFRLSEQQLHEEMPLA